MDFDLRATYRALAQMTLADLTTMRDRYLTQSTNHYLAGNRQQWRVYRVLFLLTRRLVSRHLSPRVRFARVL